MDEDGRRARLAQLALRRHSSVIHVHRVHSRYLVRRVGRGPAYMSPTGVLDFPEGRYQIGHLTANVARGPRDRSYSPMFGRPRLALLLYAVAMGYLEAVVVVYLRALYFPEGFSFPLKPIDPGMVGVEIGREAATVVMIFSVAWAAARSGWQTLTGFALVFGVWDIAYYAGLKILLGWPASLFEPDLLFLIPAVWVGPVWAPSLIGLSMSAAAWALWPMDHRVIAPRAWEWALLVAACCMLLATFIVPAALDGVTGLGEGVSLPAVSYPWWGWIAGEATALFVAVRWWMRGRTTPL